MAAEARVRVVSRIIVAVGIASAVLIYVANGPTGGGSAYELEESKKSLYELEKIGGQANVLATELRIWFGRLWHGRPLAFTVAVIAVVAALAYRFFATPLPAVDGDAREEPRGNGSSG